MNKFKKSIFLQFAFILIFSVFVVASSVSAADIVPEDIVILVNKERSKLLLPELVVDPQLSQAARDKAEDMFRNQYFQHISSDGITPWFWMEKNGYDFRSGGENLAIAFNDAISQHISWMNSEKHRKNILSENYTDTGVAVATGVFDGEITMITVELFGARKKKISYVEKQAFKVSQAVEKVDSDSDVVISNKSRYAIYKKTEKFKENALYNKIARGYILSACIGVFFLNLWLIFKSGKVFGIK